MALVQGCVPLLGAWRRHPEWMAVAGPAAAAQFLFVAGAYLCLTISFINYDFSVLYVANNSNLSLPLVYRVSAVWGGHEGSILLWSLVLAIWTLAVTAGSRSLPDQFRARVLAIMGLVSVGFLLFTIATSNPFDRLLLVPADGRDLNPLLQDPGMAIHPPLLYMGYVGLAVPFSFAIAALLDGRVDAAWTRWTRPWTTMAWIFLTLGIALGSWWAYNELGWGGWWFWDPVENGSFMPWLVATALIHSLAVTEQRGAFRAWTLLLAILGFSLSLLGTFLVRSGVLVSVHAFAADPNRGVFILIFLGIVVGGALLLFGMRAHQVSGGGQFKLFSRETLLLVNNVLLLVAAGTILLGTLYPLIVDALGLGKISVGPPYFNAVFVPLILPLIAALGIGPWTRWKGDSYRLAMRKAALPAALSAAFGGVVWVAVTQPTSVTTWIAFAAAAWILITTVQGIFVRVRHKRTTGSALRALPRRFVGMCTAHIGVSVFIVGVTAASSFSQEVDIRLVAGQSHELAGYRFRFEGVSESAGPNYRAERGHIRLYQGDTLVADLYPEKRFYSIQAQPMTEAAVNAGLTRDLYVALGESLGEGAWSMRVYYKPFIRWIWLGALIMGFGGLIAVTDPRYRRAQQPRPSPSPTSEAQVALGKTTSA